MATTARACTTSAARTITTRGDERELVVDRDRVFELNGDDNRTLAAVGTFRVVPEQELEIDAGTVRHFRDEGLVETVDLRDDERALTLTKAGRDLLDSHALKRDDETQQTFHAGVNRPREIDYDSNLYATYRQEEARLRDEHPDLEIRRVVLEQDLKREYQEFLQDHNRNRSDSDGRPDRTDDEIHDRAREHDLPYFDGQVHFPDASSSAVMRGSSGSAGLLCAPPAPDRSSETSFGHFLERPCELAIHRLVAGSGPAFRLTQKAGFANRVSLIVGS